MLQFSTAEAVLFLTLAQVLAVGKSKMAANTAPPVFSQPYHSASPMQHNVPALFLLSSLAFFSSTVFHRLFASTQLFLNKFAEISRILYNKVEIGQLGSL